MSKYYLPARVTISPREPPTTPRTQDTPPYLAKHKAVQCHTHVVFSTESHDTDNNPPTYTRTKPEGLGVLFCQANYDLSFLPTAVFPDCLRQPQHVCGDSKMQ